ncbi:hypothetical protein KV112_20675 [Mycolicibacter sp. MYC123]|uniref:Replication protein n=1 Tax=[Mycobacterium] zoologicum TaxID=2872311 RepID=A0ABU5YPX7_9MYCO|nr:hypothetical protein [Mycolicibacter sp. MYC123]MEB3052128.1 hypothetical protein [Mycolicibacter sp. MYC123]
MARSHGLGHGHIGGICDALTSTGIDPQQWTGRQLVDALSRQMADTGWSWPDRIDRPGAFLAYRLRHLPAPQPVAPTPTAPQYVPDAPVAVATAEQRAQHLATMAAALTRGGHAKGGGAYGAATSQDNSRGPGRGAQLLQAIRTGARASAAEAPAAPAVDTRTRSAGAAAARQALIAARLRVD